MRSSTTWAAIKREEHQDQDEHRVFEDRDEPAAEESLHPQGQQLFLPLAARLAPDAIDLPRLLAQPVDRDVGPVIVSIWLEPARLEVVGLRHGRPRGNGRAVPSASGPKGDEKIAPGISRGARLRGSSMGQRPHEPASRARSSPHETQPLDRTAKLHVFEKSDRLAHLVERRLDDVLAGQGAGGQGQGDQAVVGLLSELGPAVLEGVEPFGACLCEPRRADGACPAARSSVST